MLIFGGVFHGMSRQGFVDVAHVNGGCFDIFFVGFPTRRILPTLRHACVGALPGADFYEPQCLEDHPTGNNWLTTLVSKSPNWPFMAYKWG